MKYIIIVCFLCVVIPANILLGQDTTKQKNDSSLVKSKKIIINEKGFYVRSVDGKSFIKFYGSVRTSGAFDLNGLQTKQNFSTYDIPVGIENTEKRFYLSPYESRLGIEVRHNTFLGDVNMKVETDFLGSGKSVRIRHAYGIIDKFLVGQTWSVFGDPSANPVTVDIDGPNSSVSEKTVQIRYETNLKKYNFALSVESPDPNITTSDSVNLDPAFQSFPDLASHFRVDKKWGYVQMAGIFRSITIRNIDNSLGVLLGYGGLFSGKYFLGRSYSLNYQFNAGKGIARYTKGLTGKGQDVLFNNQSKENELLVSYGGFLSCNSKWNKFISTDVTFGLLKVVNKDFQPDNAFKSSFYASANIFFHIVEESNVGIEYSFGRRFNKNGESGNANRLSFTAYLDF
jgi:hypothetical protein